MGSGTKRRQGDNVAIVPQKQKNAIGAGGGSGAQSSEDQEGLVCPASFRADLSKPLFLGSRLTLRKQEGILIIEADSREVGRLNGRASKKIDDCLLSGIRYEGIVKEYKGRQYAEFTQK